MPDREMTEFLSSVVGVVEANSFERLCLWRENKGSLAWEKNPCGLMETVGTVADMPVCISLLTAKIDGYKILFLDAASQVVDHRLIDKWLDENLPRSARREHAPCVVNRTDAMNFYNIFPRRASVAA